MKMRFKRYGRIEAQTRGVTPRRLAAARRALQNERDKLPLFADLIAETQPTPEDRIKKVDAGLIEQMHEARDRYAGYWRRIRQNLRAMDPEERKHLLWYWNRSMMPATPEYLAGLIHSWNEQGWRPEVRNEEEEQAKYAAGRIKCAILYERWHKSGRPTESPVDVAATRGVYKTADEWRPALIAKMVVEEILDFSDAELARVFQGAAAVVRCIEYAKQLITEGQLTMKDIEEAATPAEKGER
ncbi:hypothetical protein [Geomonas subterranea]|uniref:hypothetical protein n=1 Tax=Geomonas subterranea TaxID=2847989 RepID=UPI001CD6A202|nr:hypothetical protein [Geomonas fuzhouensis]